MPVTAAAAAAVVVGEKEGGGKSKVNFTIFSFEFLRIFFYQKFLIKSFLTKNIKDSAHFTEILL